MAKGRTISKADLVDMVAADTGLSKKSVKETMDALLDRMARHIGSGDRVTLTGFGSFETRRRRARTGVRPGTTERIAIPASSYPAFRAGKGLKDRVAMRR